MKSKAKWLCGVFALALNCGGPPPDESASENGEIAQPYPSQETVNVYYTDATFSEPVGEEQIMTCWGQRRAMLWGVRSVYVAMDSFACAGSGEGSRSCVACSGFGANGTMYGCSWVPC